MTLILRDSFASEDSRPTLAILFLRARHLWMKAGSPFLLADDLLNCNEKIADSEKAHSAFSSKWVLTGYRSGILTS